MKRMYGPSFLLTSSFLLSTHIKISGATRESAMAEVLIMNTDAWTGSKPFSGRQCADVDILSGRIKGTEKKQQKGKGKKLWDFEKTVEKNYVLEYTVISGGKEFLWER